MVSAGASSGNGPLARTPSPEDGALPPVRGVVPAAGLARVRVNYFYVVYADKIKFNTNYSKFVLREWIKGCESEEVIRSFINKHKVVIAKPINGTKGGGIKFLDEKSISEMKNCLNNYIIEEVIKNHNNIYSISSSSLNTLRVVTILDKNKRLHFIRAIIRFGLNDSKVDNLTRGGCACVIDIDTGRIISDGLTLNGSIIKRHPKSGIDFMGFQIPMWEDVKRTITEASLIDATIRYMGWDVAILDDHVELIEGNTVPGVHLTQCDKIGVYKKVKTLI